MGISERIRLAIESQNLSLKEAAKACGLSYSSLQNWVGGLREPRPEALIAIGSHLGVSIDWLLTGEGAMLRKAGTASSHQSSTALAVEEEGLRALLQALEPEDQVEIRAVIKSMQRFRALELKVTELAADLATIKGRG